MQTAAEIEALIATASQAIGATHGSAAAFALAATETTNPQQALMFLAASSAKSSIESQEAREQNQMAQQEILHNQEHAEYRVQMVQENITNSDYTYNNRWTEQDPVNEKLVEGHKSLVRENEKLAEENRKLNEEVAKHTERFDRLEAVTKQLAAAMVQMRGGDADQASDLAPHSSHRRIATHVEPRYLTCYSR